MKNGPYELIVAPEEYPGKKYRGRYAYEHTVNWWINTGSVPSKDYEIHHINGNHRDNNIDNLKLVTSKEHRKIHSDIKRKPKIDYICGYCGNGSTRSPRNYTYNLKNNKSGLLFCSTKCGSRFQFLNN